jgi:protocatechuate 3,4-dioxygenase beta subunit
MERKKTATRRETLILLGATGAALVGCGGGDEGSDGSAGSGNSGNGSGGSAAGKGGTSGTGGSKPGTGGSVSTTGGSNGVAGANSGSGGSTSTGGTDPGSGGTGGASEGGAAGNAGGAGGASAGGKGGAGGSGGAAPVDCKSKQETTVGPFPNIDPLERRDVRGNTKGITTAKQGADLTLRIRVYDLDGFCKPIPGAVVDIWQCDAEGLYASYSAFGTGGQDFLRGYQKTNAQGVAEFLTIFPGSYSGRAIHIHFSIQAAATDLNPNSHGDSLSKIFVAQLYFEKRDIDAIFAAFAIYKSGAPITTNNADGIFVGEGGKDLLVKMSKNGSGYIGEVNVGVRRKDIGM